jgi:hypothetical protein
MQSLHTAKRALAYIIFCIVWPANKYMMIECSGDSNLSWVLAVLRFVVVLLSSSVLLPAKYLD